MSDLIDRQETINALDDLCDRECEYSKPQRSVMCGACRLGSAFDIIDELPSVQPEQQLITWLLDEIWDDDAWELNCGAFPEILCRKLVKLGYVAEEGGKYVRIDKPTGGD